jgi:hypothetical protein
VGVSFLDKFWARVDVRGPDECWLWKAGRTRGGYGAAYGPRNLHLPAHRLSWELANATEVPPGLFVCHTCDVPLCVNPAHLFVGTTFDNMADAARKGRTSRSITNAQVLELRALYSAGTPRMELSRRFNLSPSTAYSIVSRRQRRHVQ